MIADTLGTYDEQRPYLFGIAYRMIGSVTDAEDILQEAFLRWHGADREAINSPRAWLSTTVTRLCINYLNSARVQRQRYVGPWLPEPVVTNPAQSERESNQLAESLSQAFLVLLETLKPTERAVFLLREVFDYDFEEIARIVQKNPANCRQLLARARQHVEDRKPRFEAFPAEAEGILNQFLAALDSGDVCSLLAVLSADVSVITDGGGFTNASRRPIVGPDKVSRFLVGARRKFGLATRDYRFTSINHQPGFIGYSNGRAVQVGIFEIVCGGIRTIRFINNPEKLQHLRIGG